jgi:hypothetical protein
MDIEFIGKLYHLFLDKQSGIPKSPPLAPFFKRGKFKVPICKGRFGGNFLTNAPCPEGTLEP